jgi:hypothetical protein
VLDGEYAPQEVEREPSPGECLLYGLGRYFYRRWQAGVPDAIPPHKVDIQAVARYIGIWPEVEYAQTDEDDPDVEYLHFASEVLVIDRRADFPWRLVAAEEWAHERERVEFWRYHH